MREKIKKEVLEWYELQGQKPDVLMEDFIDIIIDKTIDLAFEEIKSELTNEFEKGNLEHPFVISSDYYLYLKLKDIKNKIVPCEIDEDFTENEDEEEIRKMINKGKV